MILTLWLRRDEVTLLCDRMKNDDSGTPDQAVCAYPLLLKLGSAFLEVTDQKVINNGSAEVPVGVTEPETWLLRTKIVSGDKTAADALFGVGLLRKIYRLLLDFNGPGVLLEADEEGDQMTDERRARLRRRLEVNSERRPDSNDANHPADD